jgi:hypothetical protein
MRKLIKVMTTSTEICYSASYRRPWHRGHGLSQEEVTLRYVDDVHVRSCPCVCTNLAAETWSDQWMLLCAQQLLTDSCCSDLNGKRHSLSHIMVS